MTISATRPGPARVLVPIVSSVLLLVGGLVLAGSAAAAPSPATAVTAASLSGYPTLQNGSSGDAVTALQRLLVGHGASLDVDGSFGPATKQAVSSFQSSKGLGADGVVGPATWGALVPTLRSGSTGGLVTALQHVLNLRGAGIAADGSFGPATVTAVKQAQSRAGLSQDGVAGPDTWRALVTGGSGGGGNGSNPETTYPNGQLPAGALCGISYASSWRLACYTIKDYESMNSAFRAARGKNLPITHGTLTAYRTVADQQYLWDNCPSRCARPGTSNHGFGTAIDISVTIAADRAWLEANARSYGFVQDVSGEPWHFHYVR